MQYKYKVHVDSEYQMCFVYFSAFRISATLQKRPNGHKTRAEASTLQPNSERLPFDYGTTTTDKILCALKKSSTE